MAINGIPEFVKVQPGDVIRAADWNDVQHQMRNSLRTHQHTRINGTAQADSETVDTADQISANEIADKAVTPPKMSFTIFETPKNQPLTPSGGTLNSVEFLVNAEPRGSENSIYFPTIKVDGLNYDAGGGEGTVGWVTAEIVYKVHVIKETGSTNGTTDVWVRVKNVGPWECTFNCQVFIFRK